MIIKGYTECIKRNPKVFPVTPQKSTRILKNGKKCIQSIQGEPLLVIFLLLTYGFGVLQIKFEMAR